MIAGGLLERYRGKASIYPYGIFRHNIYVVPAQNFGESHEQIVLVYLFLSYLPDPREARMLDKHTFYHTAHLRGGQAGVDSLGVDRKSTRLNSSHQIISYAVFCL